MTAAALVNSVGLAPDDWGPPACHAAPNMRERSFGRSFVRAVGACELAHVSWFGTLSALGFDGALATWRAARARIFVRPPRSAHSWSTDNHAAPFEGSCLMEDCRHEEVTI